MEGSRRRPLRLVATLAVAVAAGWLFQRLRIPLPWMLGPLLVTAGLGLAGVPVAASDRLRNGGQWVIGLALGLYFTPAVMALTVRLAPAIVLGALWALLLGYGFYRFLRWTHSADDAVGAATAYFSAAIGGASEMAVLAHRYGGQIDRVAAAHSLRLLLVVATVPFVLQTFDVHGAESAVPAASEVRALGFALLAAATGAGVWLLARLGAPNPWVLGALAVSTALTAGGVQLSALPPGLASAAQLAIGVALGARFTPQFVLKAPRWLAAVAAGTCAMMALSAAFAWALARAASLAPASVLLGNVPGGIAEMSITASVLQLSVPMVTAFHLVRYVAVLTLTAPLYRWEAARRDA